MIHMTELVTILTLTNVPFQVEAQTILGRKYPQVFVPSTEAPIIDVICHPYSEGGEQGFLEAGYRDENSKVYDVKGYLTGSEAAALIMERMGTL